MEKPSRTRLVTALTLAVVFAAGLALGLAADRSLGATPTEDLAVDAPDEQPRRVPMYEQVGTTEAQMERIDSIIHTHRASMKALQAEFRDAYNPRYQAVIESTRRAIMGVMTPEQAEEYRTLLEAYDRRRAERGSRESRE